jgi:hypothetical protein
MTKTYIVASPKDLMDRCIFANNQQNRCFLSQTKKIIWAIDYNKETNKLDLIPLR